MTEAIRAFGTLIKRGNGASPEVFTTIAEVGDIDGPTLKAQMEDVTNHSSSGGYEEKIPTTLSLGQIKFPVNFVPTGATHSSTTGIVADCKNRTKRNYQFVFPDTGATTYTFAVFVEEIAWKPSVKGVLRAEVTLSLTGPLS